MCMENPRTGITVAGDILVDVVKTIDTFPKIGMLAGISSVSMAVGGCVPNVAIDLARMDPALSVSAAGRTGDDAYGHFVYDTMVAAGIDCSRVKMDAADATGFSDVFSLPSGERTFFNMRGANTAFCPQDVDISALSCRILHTGYILLLDAMDAPDAQYGTVMARFLHDVQAAGIKTGIDVVSAAGAQYKAAVLPALKYTDYAIVNELESSMLSDLEPYHPDGRLHVENICQTMQLMADAGVTEKVIVHCKAAGFCLDVPTGRFTAVPSLKIPAEKIKGSVGAGDAFCAGALYGIYHGYDDKKMLEYASCAAAANLFAENSVDGMLPRAEVEELEKTYGRMSL